MSSLATLSAASGSSGGGFGNLLIFALPVLLIGYMIYSQRRKQRATQQMQSALRVGEDVSTTSGLYGRITALDDTVATLEISPGVLVRFDRRAVVRSTTGAPTGTSKSASSEAAKSEPSDATRSEPADAPTTPGE